MITSGTFPHGQGHETPFAQIVSDVIGAPRDSITVSYGDTSQTRLGDLYRGQQVGLPGRDGSTNVRKQNQGEDGTRCGK